MELVDLVYGQAEDHGVHDDVWYAVGADVEDVGVHALAGGVQFPELVDGDALEYGDEHHRDPPQPRHGSQDDVSPLHKGCGEETIVHGQYAPLDEGEACEENEVAGKHVLRLRLAAGREAEGGRSADHECVPQGIGPAFKGDGQVEADAAQLDAQITIGVFPP